MATLPTVEMRSAAPPLRPIVALSILDRYVLREIFGPFLFALGAFLLFWFVNIFFLAADYIINAHAPFFLLLRFLIFRIPQSTPYAFPFSCLFATLLGFGRLQADNELTALRTSGVRFSRIALTPVIAGFGMFVLSYFINDRITPAAVDLSTRTFYQIIYHTATLPIEPQFFRKDDSTGRVFYVADVAPDQRTMEGVMIFEPARLSSFRQVTTAQEAVIDGQTLVLKHADIIRFKPDGTVETELPASELAVGLPLGETASQFLASSNNDVYTLDSKHLGEQIKAMSLTGQGGNALGFLKITLAQKMSFPFASFIAVLIALPLAVMFGKKGRSLGVALSIVLLFVYFLIMSAFVAFGKNGVLNPYLAAWLPNIIMGLTGGFLFYREER
jgi:lipopolysaccharide export system permease protein